MSNGTPTKCADWNEITELVQELVCNADSDGGLIPVYWYDENPDDPDEGLDVVLLVHPHWDSRMLSEHLQRVKIGEHLDLSETKCFGDIMFSADRSDG